MVNCTGKPSYYRKDGMFVFNTTEVCQGYSHGCKECISTDDPQSNLNERKVLAIEEARERLGPRFPETLARFKHIVGDQPSVERLELMKAVAFRGWDATQ